MEKWFLLWISICSLDLVRNVVFEGTVVMGTGEADELIFSNNLQEKEKVLCFFYSNFEILKNICFSFHSD